MSAAIGEERMLGIIVAMAGFRRDEVWSGGPKRDVVLGSTELCKQTKDHVDLGAGAYDTGPAKSGCWNDFLLLPSSRPSARCGYPDQG